MQNTKSAYQIKKNWGKFPKGDGFDTIQKILSEKDIFGKIDTFKGEGGGVVSEPTQSEIPFPKT